MATQAQVHRLYLKMIDTIGLEGADTLMELLRTGYDWRQAPLEDPPLPASNRR